MKSIPGFLGYQITEWGTVYSFRGYRGKVEKMGRVLRGKINGHGRAKVTLLDVNGDKKQFHISRLVALTYIPNPNNYPIVMHRDNNPLNNHYTNLKWGTLSQNTQQAWDEGRHKGNTKLNMEWRLSIYRRYMEGGITKSQVAKEFGLSKSWTGQIIKQMQSA